MVYYAVAVGRQVGVFPTWSECEQQVKGFSGAKFKKFQSTSDAERFIANSQHEQPVSSSKSKDVGGISNCFSTKEYLAKKKSEGFTLNAEDVAVQVIQVKQENFESHDFIPLETSKDDNKIKIEIKKENLDTSLWFEDTNGDQELLDVMAALEQRSSNTENSRKNVSTDKITKPKASTLAIQSIPIKIGRYRFTADEMGFVNVYIKSDCENIGSWNGVAGYGVYFGNKHPLNTAKAATGRMTHNVAEFEAAIYAISTAKDIGIQRLCIHTDSEFILSAVSCWIRNWKRNGWRNKNGKVVQNRKELEKLDALLSSDEITIKWHKINGAVAAKALSEASKLAEIGKDEYLDLHPTKDMDNSFDDIPDFF